MNVITYPIMPELQDSGALKETSVGDADNESQDGSLAVPIINDDPHAAKSQKSEPPKVRQKRARPNEASTAAAAAKEKERVNRKKIDKLEAQVQSEWLAVQQEDDLAVAREHAQAIRCLSGSKKLGRGASDGSGETDCEVIDVVVSNEESGEESDARSEADSDNSGLVSDRLVGRKLIVLASG
jgi:hypothetical protein